MFRHETLTVRQSQGNLNGPIIKLKKQSSSTSQYNELLQLHKICDLSSVNVLLDGVVRPWVMKVLGDLTLGIQFLVKSRKVTST
jgi:hypothetical protein